MQPSTQIPPPPASPPPATRPVSGLRWWIIGLIGLATVINYIDRNALAVMWPGVAEDLNMGKEQYALVVTFFMVAYGLSQSLSGRMFDKVGTRIGFTISIVVWSVAAGLHALSRGLLSFALFRALLGLGEAGNWPGAAKSNAEWFPIKERAFAQGLFNAGASLGAVISAPLIAYLYGAVGWRTTFVLIGGLGLLWVIPWLIINKAVPKYHPWLSEHERKYILEGQATPETDAAPDVALSIRELLRYRQSWAVLLSRFMLDPIWWLFVSWLPIYLHERFQFDIKQIGAFAWVPYVGAAIGSLGGGLLSGRLITGGATVNRARKICIVLGCVIMLPALLLSAWATTATMAMGTIFVALLGFQIAIGNIQTLPSDFFSGKSVGALAGLSGTSAVFGTLITTWLVPVLTRESYTPFFIMAALLVPLGAAAVLLLSGTIRRLPLRQQPS
ncbi:MFS transporter [Hymenobacter psychrophilus]|uniref:MFS transporter, ACS family, hexuronate transporter n=1 Tax=Hymenobacter psychrophilus TaxID=651662 RepID=A0A1H3LAP8_9BACT|nr:MFS transporter [Hymenobacter psychrophilus]SDY61380.1 MFS transporter, ACS family, hexuronate transporter [Hymenobacter psychrophilus]